MSSIIHELSNATGNAAERVMKQFPEEYKGKTVEEVESDMKARSRRKKYEEYQEVCSILDNKTEKAQTPDIDSGFRGLLDKNNTFDSFITINEEQSTIKRLALQFTEENNNKWMFFSGPDGSGKTHIGTAIFFAIADSYKNPSYYNVMVSSEAIRMKHMNEYCGESKRMIDLFKKADLLFIDDFMCRETTDKELSAYASIIEQRYMLDLKTIICSCRNLDYIAKRNFRLCNRIKDRSRGFTIQL